MEHFLYTLLSNIHFVLYGVLFAHEHTFYAVQSILLSSVHFVLYRALIAHPTLERTFCAVWSTFCTSYSQAYILQKACHLTLSHISQATVHNYNKLYGYILELMRIQRSYHTVYIVVGILQEKVNIFAPLSVQPS